MRRWCKCESRGIAQPHLCCRGCVGGVASKKFKTDRHRVESSPEMPSCEAWGSKARRVPWQRHSGGLCGWTCPASLPAPTLRWEPSCPPSARSHRGRAGCPPCPCTPGAPNGCRRQPPLLPQPPGVHRTPTRHAPRCACRETRDTSAKTCSGPYRYAEIGLAKHLCVCGLPFKRIYTSSNVYMYVFIKTHLLWATEQKSKEAQEHKRDSMDTERVCVCVRVHACVLRYST